MATVAPASPKTWPSEAARDLASRIFFSRVTLMDPDFDRDANDDPITAEGLDLSFYNTGRPAHEAR